jgi:hypothetical protein
VGRGREFLRVVAALSERRSLLVVGPAGIGKSAVVEAGLETAGVPAVVVRGVELARTAPLLPLRAALGPLPGAGAAQVASDGGSARRRRLVVEDLHALDGDTLDVLAEVTGCTSVLATVRTGIDPVPAVALAGMTDWVLWSRRVRLSRGFATSHGLAVPTEGNRLRVVQLQCQATFV